jgi:hypothetical protein
LVQYGALIVVLVDLIKEGEKPTKEKLPYSSPMNCFYEQRELAFVPLIHKPFCAGIAGACLQQVI